MIELLIPVICHQIVICVSAILRTKSQKKKIWKVYPKIWTGDYSNSHISFADNVLAWKMKSPLHFIDYFKSHCCISIDIY